MGRFYKQLSNGEQSHCKKTIWLSIQNCQVCLNLFVMSVVRSLIIFELNIDKFEGAQLELL